MDIERFNADVSANNVVEAVRRDGGAIVESVVDVETIDRINAEFRPEFDTVGATTMNDFNGYKTLRIGSVLGYAPTSADLIGHRLVLEVADALLLPHCENYQIGSNTAIEILPGEDQQVLHRDDTIYPIRMPGMEWQISALWALDDFTEENGATHVVVGSHRQVDPDNVPENKDSIQAVMPKGSVLFYLGTTWHGGGANRSNSPRLALVNTYALGWLRQEVNQYIDVSQEMVASYPEHIRRLLGYQMHGDILGHHRAHNHINPNWVSDWQRSGLPKD